MSLYHPTPNYATPPRTAPIISEGFPYWVNHYPLHAAPDHSYPWHWHTELELFYIHEGAIDYYVPSGLFRAQQGDVGLINSGALHMTRCSQNQISIAAEHIFSPIFISTMPQKSRWTISPKQRTLAQENAAAVSSVSLAFPPLNI